MLGRTMKLTDSESLFEDYCLNNSICCKRIQADDKPSPDYLINVNGIEIAVEVKQIEPNSEELKAEALLKSEGFSTSSATPGHRVRKKITDSAPQLKRYAELGKPTLLLLFSTNQFASHVGPYHIRVAMYGFQTIHYAVPKNRKVSPYVTGESLGKGKKMTETHNTSISAVAVMSRTHDGTIVAIYHNKHAKLAIDSAATQSAFPKQYELTELNPNRAPDWREIQSAP